MQGTIKAKLKAIAQQEGVTILYACESGSRAWGFASADSDWDVRFIYARPVTDYLQLRPPRDVIELPIEDDLDINGWDIFKACQLLRKSNPPLLEWLGSPTVYLEPSTFAAALRDQARQHCSVRACCEHYLSMVTSHYQAHVLGRSLVVRKRYLYGLRPIASIEWMLRHRTFPPTPFADVLAEIDLPDAVRQEIDRLLDDKRQNKEMGQTPANECLSGYLADQVVRFEPLVQDLEPQPFPTSGLDRIIQEILLDHPGMA